MSHISRIFKVNNNKVESARATKIFNNQTRVFIIDEQKKSSLLNNLLFVYSQKKNIFRIIPHIDLTLLMTKKNDLNKNIIYAPNCL